MASKKTEISDALYGYLLTVGVREDEAMQALREETQNLPNGHWATTPEQAALLQLLVRLIDARKILDIGTFTGYSAMALALAIPEDGQVITCDVAAGWSEMGVHYWRQAGVEGRIDRRIGRAEETLTGLIKAGDARSFDMIFIDANRAEYLTYLELSAVLLRPGGLLIADNVLRRGKVLDAADTSPETEAVRRFNQSMHDDPRFHICMLPVADGMTLAIKQ